MLDEGLARGTPSPGHNLLIDLVANLQPFLPVGGERPLIGQPQAAIDSDPAHELGIDEMAPPFASLPDAFIFPPPVMADPVDQPSEVRPELRRDRTSVLIVQIDRIHQLAVDVQLQLIVSAI